MNSVIFLKSWRYEIGIFGVSEILEMGEIGKKCVWRGDELIRS